MNFVQNILWNSVEGFVEAGTRSVGEYAGDALIKAGDLIENSGRGVGESIERSASGYGQKIAGQGYQPGPKALPAPSKKVAVKRSSTTPPSITRKAPIAAKKALPSAKTAVKQITNGSTVSGAKSTGAGAQKSATKAQKAITGGAATKTSNLPKAYPNNVPYGTSITPSGTKRSTIGAAKANNLPKPYPQSNSTSYPTSKKTPVTPGRPKPFIVENRTLGGSEAKKTPVRPQKYGPTAEKGKVQHIPLSGVGLKVGNNGGGGGGGGKMQHIPIGDLGIGGKSGGAGKKAPMDSGAGKMQHIPVG